MAANSPTTKYNWPAVFVAYCNGCPLEELAQVYGIELITLRAYEMNQGWAKLRASIPQAQETALMKPGDAARKLKLIEENRLQNLGIWVELRDHLLTVVRDLKDGKLKIERLFHNKGMIVRDETDPTTGDMVNIAAYAKTIAEGTYRALGDFQAQEKAGQDASAGAAASGVPAITIILPGVIAAPREQRAARGQVIDVAGVTDGQAPPDAQPDPH